MSLPLSRNQSSSSVNSQSGLSNIPPRPPPPRVSPGSIRQHSKWESSPTEDRRTSASPPPPVLPPKQSRSHTSTLHGNVPTAVAASNSASNTVSYSLPPPLIPVPSLQPQTTSSDTQPKTVTETTKPTTSLNVDSGKGNKVPPAIPPRQIDQWHRKTLPKSEVHIAPPPGNPSQESADNASNECCVCWENPPNSVLYTCGHMCMCYDCAVDIKENQGGLCPMCRKEIKDIIKIFRS